MKTSCSYRSQFKREHRRAGTARTTRLGLGLSSVLALLAPGPAAGQGPGGAPTAAPQTAETYIRQRDYGPGALPVYRQALDGAARIGNDSRRRRYAYFVGRCYYTAGQLDSAVANFRRGAAAAAPWSAAGLRAAGGRVPAVSGPRVPGEPD